MMGGGQDDVGGNAGGKGYRGGGGGEEDELRREYLGVWQSGSANRKAVSFKRAAKEAFGLSGSVYDPLGLGGPTEEQVGRAERAVRFAYRETQQALADSGISEVTLYRGVAGPYDEVGAVEAWTSDPLVAEDYAGPGGVVLVEVVPAARVLAWYDGPGWPEGPPNREWIVLSEEPG